MALRSAFPALLLLVVDVVRAQGLGGLWPVPQPTFTSGSTPLFISESIGVTYNGARVRWSTHEQLPSFEDMYAEISQPQLAISDNFKRAGSLSNSDIVQAGVSRALDNIFSQNFVPWMLVPRHSISNYEPSCNGTVTIKALDISLTSNSTDASFTPSVADIDESYTLSISEQGAAKISASTATGVLRGLETFSQLFYESTDGTYYLVNAPIDIADAPKYPWRGVLVDTARNFLPVETLERTIDAMAASKLNKLHVHVTDSQSWPLEVPSLPELSSKGAYAPSQVYSPEDIESLQVYGIYRGVDVYFEIDMPGHIGVVGEAFPDLIVAYDARPYTTYCAEPPCGAFKLNNTNVENFLGTLFDDVLPRVNRYTSFWHTGGDELNANDYLLDPELNTNESAVLQPLLQAFIDTQHDRVRNAGLNPMVWEEIPTTWNVTLGSDVVVQSWLGGTAVADLANAGHKVIDSNYNFWVSDCSLTFIPRLARDLIL